MASQVDGTVPWLVDETGGVVGFKRNNGTEGYIAQLATDAGGEPNAAASIAAWQGISLVTVAGRQK